MSNPVKVVYNNAQDSDLRRANKAPQPAKVAIQKRYDKVIEKLEALNNEATELEQQLMEMKE